VLRSLPNPLTPDEQARLRDARPGGPAPASATSLLRVDRRISSRGSISVAGQRIQVGIGHAGRTVTVEQADTSFRVYDADQLLVEVTRTTTKTIARFKARNPSPRAPPGLDRIQIDSPRHDRHSDAVSRTYLVQQAEQQRAGSNPRTHRPAGCFNRTLARSVNIRARELSGAA
jgi:hypothetical protein